MVFSFQTLSLHCIFTKQKGLKSHVTIEDSLAFFLERHRYSSPPTNPSSYLDDLKRGPPLHVAAALEPEAPGGVKTI